MATDEFKGDDVHGGIMVVFPAKEATELSAASEGTFFDVVMV